MTSVLKGGVNVDFSFWVNECLGLLYACLCLYRYKNAYLLWWRG